MTSVASRVARLERQIGTAGHGRIITIRSNGGGEAEAADFLKRQGIVVDHRKDLLVHLQTLYLDRNENPVTPPDFGLELINVVEMRG